MIEALINTVQILLVIPILGMTLGYLEKIVGNFIAKHIGVKCALFIMNKLTFVGVAHHELSHALFAFISGAKIREINLFKPQGNSLGSVQIVPRGNKILKSIQLTLTAIAPVVTGIISMCTIAYFVSINIEIMLVWQIILIAYLFISIFFHSTMSTADLKCAIKGLPVCACILLVIVAITDFSLIKFIGGLIN